MTTSNQKEVKKTANLMTTFASNHDFIVALIRGWRMKNAMPHFSLFDIDQEPEYLKSSQLKLETAQSIEKLILELQAVDIDSFTAGAQRHPVKNQDFALLATVTCSAVRLLTKEETAAPETLEGDVLRVEFAALMKDGTESTFAAHIRF